MGDYRFTDTENNLIAIRDINKTVNENRVLIQKFLKGLYELIVEIDGEIDFNVIHTLERTTHYLENQIRGYQEEVKRLRERIQELEQRISGKDEL